MSAWIAGRPRCRSRIAFAASSQMALVIDIQQLAQALDSARAQLTQGSLDHFWNARPAARMHCGLGASVRDCRVPLRISIFRGGQEHFRRSQARRKRRAVGQGGRLRSRRPRWSPGGGLRRAHVPPRYTTPGASNAGTCARVHVALFEPRRERSLHSPFPKRRGFLHMPIGDPGRRHHLREQVHSALREQYRPAANVRAADLPIGAALDCADHAIGNSADWHDILPACRLSHPEKARDLANSGLSHRSRGEPCFRQLANPMK
jgi:hypothetical protein